MPKIPKKIVQKKVKEAPKKAKVEEEDVDAGAESADDVEEDPARLSSDNEETHSDTPKDSAEEVDYLRKYQYKRELPLGDPGTDPQPGGKSAAMKRFLLGQRKITILIPLDEGSDPKVPYSVNLNGYRLDLPTNTYVEVPEQVAEVIMQSQKQTVAALSQFQSRAEQ